MACGPKKGVVTKKKKSTMRSLKVIILLKNLNHPQPQFQKSRAASAISLGEFGFTEAIPLLEKTAESLRVLNEKEKKS